MLLWLVPGILFITFGLIVLRGAPFVPTKQKDLTKLLELLKLTDNDRLVDLGSGDGRLLIVAAKGGYKVTGYELNPFLVFVTLWRIRNCKHLANVRMVDFWLTPLPADTTVVFTFLAGPYMKRLDKYMARETKRLGHDIRLVSYGFPIPKRSVDYQLDPFIVYRFKH